MSLRLRFLEIRGTISQAPPHSNKYVQIKLRGIYMAWLNLISRIFINKQWSSFGNCLDFMQELFFSVSEWFFLVVVWLNIATKLWKLWPF